MVDRSVSMIEVGGILYKVVRTLKADHVNMIDDWKATMCRLYRADNIYQKDGVLYVVQEITDVHPI